MNEQTKELETRISKVKEEIAKVFDEDAINNFEPKLKSDLKEINYNCANALVEQLEKCDRLLKAPVYVGMLGRYSHGKSALVNSLFLLDEDNHLPVGDYIVTSKVTRVTFDDTITSATAYKHFNGNQDCEQFTDYSEFQTMARKNDEDNSGIAFLEAKIPIGQKQTLAKNFFQNNIQLIDMPGLGGAYFDDSAMTREYMENVDLVVVAIKITEIEESAAAVNKFLQKVTCPKIAVLTFYDLTETDNKFASCGGDMAKILTKAKQEVDQYFTNLGDSDDIIAVSINHSSLVDKVRERILQKITVQNIATTKANKETPVVKKRRANELKRELDVLKQKALDLPKRLEILITNTIGKDEDNKIDICSIFESLAVRNKQQKRKKDIDNEFKTFKREQTSTINSIMDVSECDSVCEKIKKEVELLLDKFSERFNDYKTDLKDVADGYIADLNVTEKQKKEFKQLVKEILNDYSNVFEDVTFDDKSVKIAATVEIAKGMIQRILKFLHITSKSEKEAARKAKERMKGALVKSLTKLEKDISKQIENADTQIQKSFRDEIDMSTINQDVKNLKGKKDKIIEKIDELLEVIETVKYKI